MTNSIDFILHYLPLIAGGAVTTVGLFLASLVVGTVLGLVVALMRLSRITPLVWFASLFVWLGRGIPALVILFFSYYALPRVIGVGLEPYQAAIIGLGLETGAFQGEVIRSGLLSVDSGQYEAAKALGMSQGHLMRRIILPQAIRVAIPPYFSSAMALLRTTSLASVITVQEMTGLANRFVASTFRPLEIIGIVGLLYLALSSVLQLIQLLLERRFALPK
jgi:His/Glu/Gln/Arg/opine family amino acid ABC transporter permease subunit